MLLDKRRDGALGGSEIGAKREQPAHQKLRKEQRFDAALAFFKAEGRGFNAWNVIEFERALLWGAVEHRVAAWGGAAPGSLLARIAIFAACYFGEALMLALLVGGTPSPELRDLAAWVHHVQNLEVQLLSPKLFDAGRLLRRELVPAGATLLYRVWLGSGRMLEFDIDSLEALERALRTLRGGGTDDRGAAVPQPASIVDESEEQTEARAKAQAGDLAGLASGVRLAPGAKAWCLVVRQAAGERRLMGREGWHGDYMMKQLRLEWPAQPTTRSDALLLRAAAQPRRTHAKQLEAARANAERELLDAVKGRGDARHDALELVELVQQRGQRLPAEIEPLIEAVAEALDEQGLGDVAQRFDRTSLEETMHSVMPQAVGGAVAAPPSPRPRSAITQTRCALTCLALHHTSRPRAH